MIQYLEKIPCSLQKAVGAQGYVNVE